MTMESIKLVRNTSTHAKAKYVVGKGEPQHFGFDGRAAQHFIPSGRITAYTEEGAVSILDRQNTDGPS